MRERSQRQIGGILLRLKLMNYRFIRATLRFQVLSLLCDEQKRLHPAVKKVASEKLAQVPIDISPLRPMRKRFKPDPDVIFFYYNVKTRLW